MKSWMIFAVYIIKLYYQNCWIITTHYFIASSQKNLEDIDYELSLTTKTLDAILKNWNYKRKAKQYFYL